jgi:hypothetical protein
MTAAGLKHFHLLLSLSLSLSSCTDSHSVVSSLRSSSLTHFEEQCLLLVTTVVPNAITSGGGVFNNLWSINRLMETVKFHNTTVPTHNLVVGYKRSVSINGREHLLLNVKLN